MAVSRSVRVQNWRGDRPDGPPVEDRIAAEVPVALTYNRVAYVVMMATPDELEDFALGFSLTEGLIGQPADLLGINVIPRAGGLELAMIITEDCFDRLATRRRNMAGRTGCGLCGAENLQQAVRLPMPVPQRLTLSHAALQRAVDALETHQPLQAATGATHAAAWCDRDGQILCLREDVGRHNALDKLLGSLLRGGFDASQGFVLVSSRASYEMVYKTAAAGIELLAAVSAPTTLAVEFGVRCGLTLVGFARPGRHNLYTHPERLTNRDEGSD
jgi:FdhD protein